MNSRFESLNFRGSNGDVQQLPRVRFRLGQNLSISEGTSRPYLGVYEEAIMHQKLPTPASIPKVLDFRRFMASTTGKERVSCWDSRRKPKFRAADRQ